MTSAHTPGPWFVVQNGGQIDIHYRDVVADRELTLVAHVRERDSRLIAAAPSLLAELKHLTEAIKEGHITVSPKFSPLYSQALAAIEQAEGSTLPS